jgi:hypothetical protein
MAGYSLELDLQNPWFCPFAFDSESDITHGGVKGRASCVRREACIVETTAGVDLLGHYMAPLAYAQMQVVAQAVRVGRNPESAPA